MHFLRVLLMAALSLGLQVPGGIAFDLCFCQGLSGVFHTHGDEAARGSCCVEGRDDAGCGGGQECGTSGRTSAKDDAGNCDGCFELRTPEHPDRSTPPRAVSVAPPFITELEAGWSPSQSADVPVAVADRGHDPPWERRNLLLRI